MKTLKILILSGLMFLPGLNLKAQKINYGIQAGYVYANAHVRKDNEHATRIFYPIHSFNINGYIEYRFPGKWGIAAEPGYIRKGSDVDGKKNFLGRFNLQLNYIQLPILANFYFGDKLFISFGPEFAYLINKDVNIPSPPPPSHSIDKEADKMFTPFKDNAFEVSWVIGVNCSITERIDIGLRYNHGITHFSKATWINSRYPMGWGSMGQSKAYNQYVQFIVRYRIRN